MMFLRRCRLVVALLETSSFMYVKLSSKLLRLRASWYVGAAVWNVGSSHESFDIRLLIDDGSCLKIEGGWFDWLWM